MHGGCKTSTAILERAHFLCFGEALRALAAKRTIACCVYVTTLRGVRAFLSLHVWNTRVRLALQNLRSSPCRNASALLTFAFIVCDTRYPPTRSLSASSYLSTQVALEEAQPLPKLAAYTTEGAFPRDVPHSIKELGEGVVIRSNPTPGFLRGVGCDTVPLMVEAKKTHTGNKFRRLLLYVYL